MNVFYVSIRTTESYEFDKIRTAGVTGNATTYKNCQGDNPICSTRDEISQPSRTFSPRAATACDCGAVTSASMPLTSQPQLPHVNAGFARTGVQGFLLCQFSGV